LKPQNFTNNNLAGLMKYEAVPNDYTGAGQPAYPANTIPTTDVKVCIPLKYVAPIFDSDVLMPPHMARALRIDITLEDVAAAFCSVATTAPTGYEISQPYVLCDSYRMSDSVLAFVNENFASKDVGLVYEYSSWHTNTSSTAIGVGDINIEVRRSVSMALDVMLISRPQLGLTNITYDSFSSVPATENDRFYYRCGSHYLPNQQVEGTVEAYFQMLYWCNKLRDEQQTATTLNKFVGKGDAPDGTNGPNYSLSKYNATLQRNNILDQSGMMINNSQTLSIQSRLSSTVARSSSIYLRHIRRCVNFLENCVLET
jgi:hypothetical protein